MSGHSKWSTIKRKKGAEAENYTETTFEGYGPFGIAVYAECLTDNNNRTVAAIRSAFNKHGGSLGTKGSLSFLFDSKGIFTFMNEGLSLEEVELEMIDAGAEDFEIDRDMVTISCAKEDFGSVSRKLSEVGIAPEESGLKRIPNDTKKLDVDSARKVLKFIETLEDDDDIQNR